jgi:hypothetical protein
MNIKTIYWPRLAYALMREDGVELGRYKTLKEAESAQMLLARNIAALTPEELNEKLAAEFERVNQLFRKLQAINGGAA